MTTDWKGKFQVNPLSERTRKMLDNNFVYHKPIGDQPDRYEVIRSMAKELAEAIYYLSPESREQSLAITELESAVMWANAAIARNEK